MTNQDFASAIGTGVSPTTGNSIDVWEHAENANADGSQNMVSDQDIGIITGSITDYRDKYDWIYNNYASSNSLDQDPSIVSLQGNKIDIQSDVSVSNLGSSSIETTVANYVLRGKSKPVAAPAVISGIELVSLVRDTEFYSYHYSDTITGNILIDTSALDDDGCSVITTTQLTGTMNTVFTEGEICNYYPSSGKHLYLDATTDVYDDLSGSALKLSATAAPVDGTSVSKSSKKMGKTNFVPDSESWPIQNYAVINLDTGQASIVQLYNSPWQNPFT
jgi:hypothetical protein